MAVVGGYECFGRSDMDILKSEGIEEEIVWRTVPGSIHYLVTYGTRLR